MTLPWPGEELKHTLDTVCIVSCNDCCKYTNIKKAKQPLNPARTDSQMEKFVIVFMIFRNVFAGFHSLV